MEWIKQGHVFVPDGNAGWMNSHAGNPFAMQVSDSLYKVFFTCRDAENRSHISWALVDFDNNFGVVEVAEKPVLEPGELGLFDDSGVMMGFLLPHEDKLYLYYLGWNLKVTVPWQNSIGLAISEDGGKTFKKYSKAPILDRNHHDPYSVSYPSIISRGDSYQMWYGSNLSWGSDQSEMKHVIKSASSNDAIQWDIHGRVAVNLKSEVEYALSKPFVILKDGIHYMWYSYRASIESDTYRIGIAVSSNGEDWERRDEMVGISTSDSGWDSEMIEYPWIGKHRDQYVMLYNGNGYGRTGFGAAITKDIILI